MDAVRAPLIRARSLTKKFGTFVAVDAIDFDVSPGEAFGPQSGGFLRLSYATSDEDLAEGLTRLETGLAAARQG